MALIIVSTLVGICITIWLWGIITHNENMTYGGASMGIIIGLFGGISCSTVPDHTQIVERKDFKYAKANSHVLVELPDGFTQVFSDAFTYNNIEQVKVLYDKYKINSYGFEISRKIDINK